MCTVLKADMSAEEVNVLARKLGVSALALRDTEVRDHADNKVPHVVSVDLATGGAVLILSTASGSSKSCCYAETADGGFSPIEVHANLSGCHLSFADPVNADIKIPVAHIADSSAFDVTWYPKTLGL